MVYINKDQYYINLINNHRKKLEEMMLAKSLHTDEELVELSQELDELIVEYHQWKASQKKAL